METNQEKEFYILLMETDMMEILKMIKEKEKEFFILLMETDMKEIL